MIIAAMTIATRASLGIIFPAFPIEPFGYKSLNKNANGGYRGAALAKIRVAMDSGGKFAL
jgi:hypothetical protein